MLAQVIELYSENGLDRPFFATFATPFSGNVVRVLNTGPMEYPLTASIVRPRLTISASRSCAGTQKPELYLRTDTVIILVKAF